MARVPKTPAANLDRFIQALAAGSSVIAACKAACIGRRTAYDHRQRDEAFALRWADALEEGTDKLEDEAHRRALDGSDSLLIFLLKARRPEKYRESVKVEHAGSIDVAPDRLAEAREAGLDPDFEAKAAAFLAAFRDDT
jgi:hypothetical protein